MSKSDHLGKPVCGRPKACLWCHSILVVLYSWNYPRRCGIWL